MKIHLYINTKFTGLVLLIFALSSCITNRDLEYIASNKEFREIKVNRQDYRLQNGDLLSVQISTLTEQQHDFFNKESSVNSQLILQNPYLFGYVIKDDGTLDLPSLGNVNAAGFTLRELENIIKNIAVSYFESPVIKLNIINFEITVLGEVNNPGTFKIIDPEVNILYALSLSNDITQFGNRRKVKVIRSEDKFNRVFYIDLTKKDILSNSDFMLQPNDIIYVAPIRKKFYAFNNITNIVSISLSAVSLFLLINQN
jgi:polysaccharide export outer membrane protein